MKTISRAEAKKLSLKRYYTGILCPRNHDSERLVSNYKCVRCSRTDAGKYRERNPGSGKEARKEWLKKNPNYMAQKQKEYRERDPKLTSQRVMDYQKKNPEKISAHVLVRVAVKSGELTKPSHCERCHKEKKLQGHHDDYSKPLEVEWLCQSCHSQHHKMENPDE